ncbi:hypothetical protein T484DRAFT_1778180 [Baffinella frigidus]|nr:hypothetical protein T484DRAFT_1778180 [Cryptophyta sp. CCMP2293]
MGSAAGEMERELARRATFLGPSLSTHYRSPIIARRGRGTFLFDDAGQPLLDLVNNPASLGHCHEAVTAAAADQMGRLNTNTRYVYPEISDYAEAPRQPPIAA